MSATVLHKYFPHLQFSYTSWCRTAYCVYALLSYSPFPSPIHHCFCGGWEPRGCKSWLAVCLWWPRSCMEYSLLCVTPVVGSVPMMVWRPWDWGLGPRGQSVSWCLAEELWRHVATDVYFVHNANMLICVYFVFILCNDYDFICFYAFSNI